MTILVTGSTGTIGSEVIRQLSARGIKAKALMREPDGRTLPAGITAVKGDMTDIDSMRAALKGVDTVFLINAVVPDELTQALTTLGIAREAGVQAYVYLSVLMSDKFTDVPHFSGKYAVERMIEAEDMPATILRPAYFIQNDLSLKDAILGGGVYPQPIGERGIAMADIRDISEIAVLELIRRDQAPGPLARETILIGGPDNLTGKEIAAIWTERLGKSVKYGGDDLAAYEQAMRKFAPGWMAYDIRTMMRGFQKHGMLTTSEASKRLEIMLGRPLRTYRDFAGETAATWQSA